MAVEITIADVLDNFHIEISCNDCGKSLEASWWNGEIVVDSCEICTGEAYEEGLTDGRNK